MMSATWPIVHMRTDTSCKIIITPLSEHSLYPAEVGQPACMASLEDYIQITLLRLLLLVWDEKLQSITCFQGLG